jgi:hypothetical protein
VLASAHCLVPFVSNRTSIRTENGAHVTRSPFHAEPAQIDRGIFTSVADLKRKILRYIRLYQKAAKPFQWKYSDVRKRIPAW